MITLFCPPTALTNGGAEGSNIGAETPGTAGPGVSAAADLCSGPVPTCFFKHSKTILQAPNRD